MMQKLQKMMTQFSHFKTIPIIAVDTIDEALGLGEVLVQAGLPVAEVTFRSDNAALAMKAMKETYPELLVGAGTILNAGQATLARDHGADFIVSPGFNLNTVKACQSMRLPIIPGINNPMGIEMALESGLTMLKFFPAETSGGIAMIKALLAPYRDITIMPTGGIGVHNVAEYLEIDRVIACGLSWMVDPKLLKAKDWAQVASRITELKKIV